MYVIDRGRKLTLWERIYLPEIIRGLAITARHFFKNLIHMNTRMTIEYPEQKHKLPIGYRAEHRLMIRPEGDIRCTACMCCSTICPADCIEIVAEESPNKEIEKRPAAFNINLLRCVFCGLCVEACPCDAIRMDTGKYENSQYTREDFIYDIDKLRNNHPDGVSPYSIALY